MIFAKYELIDEIKANELPEHVALLAKFRCARLFPASSVGSKSAAVSLFFFLVSVSETQWY
jgi:hypothetical protein